MVIFSQDQEPSDFPQGSSELDNPTTPIDNNLYLVLIIGVVYVFFELKKYIKKGNPLN